MLLSFAELCASQPTDTTKHSTIFDKMPLSDKIALSTIQIITKGGTGYVFGSGFFFRFDVGGYNIPVIVTNKHVIKNAATGWLNFCTVNPDSTPNRIDQFKVTLDSFESRWILHPESSVDIAIMPIADIERASQAKGSPICYVASEKSIIPKAQDFKEFKAVEDILMVGYPEGIADRYNNYPIFRRGITATHLANKYEGRDEFMIDIACYHGSSGSPVFLYYSGSYSLNGALIPGDRVYLLGIFYAGMEYTADGQIKVVSNPQGLDTLAQTKIPVNLGKVIRSSKLLDFEPILLNLINAGATKH